MCTFCLFFKYRQNTLNQSFINNKYVQFVIVPLVTAKSEFIGVKKKDAQEACDLYQTQLNLLGTGASCTLK